jgi:hypothetical protein
MDEFADSLGRFADRPVVNMTGAPGRFDFTMDMTPEDYRAILIRGAVNSGVTLPPEALRLLEGFSGESTFLALQSVGLKLESRKAPLDGLPIESLENADRELIAAVRASEAACACQSRSASIRRRSIALRASASRCPRPGILGHGPALIRGSSSLPHSRRCWRRRARVAGVTFAARAQSRSRAAVSSIPT